MSTAHILKVVNEHQIDCGPSRSTYNGYCLRGDFFRDLDAKSCGNSCNEPYKCWSAFFCDCFFQKKLGSLCY